MIPFNPYGVRLSTGALIFERWRNGELLHFVFDDELAKRSSQNSERPLTAQEEAEYSEYLRTLTPEQDEQRKRLALQGTW